MMRYRAPKGTAGLARSRVSGHKRSPWPPARSTPMASLIADMAGLRTHFSKAAHSNSTSQAKHKNRQESKNSQFPGASPPHLLCT